jgi:hypothetical protein
VIFEEGGNKTDEEKAYPYEAAKRGLVVAVLQLLQFSRGIPHTLKILLYLYIYYIYNIYINIELIFDFGRTYFGTATTATLQQ